MGVGKRKDKNDSEGEEEHDKRKKGKKEDKLMRSLKPIPQALRDFKTRLKPRIITLRADRGALRKPSVPYPDLVSSFRGHDNLRILFIDR